MHGNEIKILLADDLITSGSTLCKAAEMIHGLLPRAKIYGASLGFRPSHRIKPSEQSLDFQHGAHSRMMT